MGRARTPVERSPGLNARKESRSETQAIVSLGSNVEPRADYLRRAVDELSALPETRFVRASSVIETEPVDVPAEFAAMKFLNQVAVFATRLEPLDFSRRMHGVEDRLGRVRTVRNGPRTIDVDLVDFGGLRLTSPELTLPHPRACQRNFVLRPLAELGLTVFGTYGGNSESEKGANRW